MSAPLESGPTALIVDDEPALRDALRRLLARAWPELTIVGEATHAAEALARFAACEPHIVFLDIQMPGRSGLDVARDLSGRTHIVFVTAYDEYAVQAFDRGAVDYLLKPVDADRLATTVGRLRGRLDAPRADVGAIVRSLLAGAAPRRQYLQWLQVSDHDDIRLLPVGDVALIQSADKYTLVTTPSKEWVIRTPLKELEEGLDPDAFWRVHRNAIVRVGAIDRVRRDLAGRLSVTLQGVDKAVAVSRAFAHLFRQM